MLPKDLKNELLKEILDAGLNPSQFRWVKSPEDATVRDEVEENLLSVSVPEFYYLFRSRGLALLSQSWFPSKSGHDSYTSNSVDRTTVISHFSEWLYRVKEFTETPDLWEAMGAYDQIASEDGQVELGNEQFSAPQADRVIQAIAEIKGLLEESGKITEENRSFVEQRLKHLEESAKRLGKKDYFTLAVGTMVTISTALTLDPARAKVIWGVLQAAIQGAARLLPGM